MIYQTYTAIRPAQIWETIRVGKNSIFTQGTILHMCTYLYEFIISSSGLALNRLHIPPLKFTFVHIVM
jgi:hypothetical protein